MKRLLSCQGVIEESQSPARPPLPNFATCSSPLRVPGNALLRGLLAIGCVLGGCLSATSLVLAEETIQVLKPETLMQPDQMMINWLNEQTRAAYDRWEKRYDSLKTPADISTYQQRQRQEFVERLGGFPERTPLNAQVTGVVQRKGYRVEKVLFESQPNHHVTGLCFIPEDEKFQAPYPATVIVCGHSANGKAQDGYQSGAALLALNGIVGFIIDPICQGERYQYLDENGKILVPSSTVGHTLIGLGSILLGQNTARFEIWDGMRAIDYLQTREDVIGEKIGCMGNSGGGTQTAYLMALEDRIAAASPSCYITTFEQLLDKLGPQDAEQNIFGQIEAGIDHADYLLMRAPVPIHMCVATQDFFPIDGAWESFRKAKRIYSRLGYPERVSLAEVDEKHGWHQPLRESAVQWMSRWLAGSDHSVRQPEIELLTGNDLNASPTGQVQQIPGDLSCYELNLAEYEKFAAGREQLWKNPEQALQRVREIAGIRQWSDIPEPQAKKTGSSTVEGITIEHWALQPEPGIYLAGLLYLPAKASAAAPDQRVIVYVNEEGKQATFTRDGQEYSPLKLAQEGAIVFAVDLRGQGETAPQGGRWYNARFGEDGKHVVIAYLLGKNYVGLRAEDLSASLKWLDTRLKRDTGAGVELISVGETGPAALHAAALQPGAISQLQLIRSLADWKQIITSPLSEDQTVNCIHGAVRSYELTDLVNVLGDRVEVIEPLNALKLPLEN